MDNLTKSLKELKTLEEELLEKEEFLEDIEEPGMSNIDNLIGNVANMLILKFSMKFENIYFYYN